MPKFLGKFAGRRWKYGQCKHQNWPLGYSVQQAWRNGKSSIAFN